MLLALMGLFNSNKGGNTSESTMAKDRRGDLHIPPLVSDWEMTYMKWPEGHTKKHCYAYTNTDTCTKVTLKNIYPWLSGMKWRFYICIYKISCINRPTHCKSTFWRTMLSTVGAVSTYVGMDGGGGERGAGLRGGSLHMNNCWGWMSHILPLWCSAIHCVKIMDGAT